MSVLILFLSFILIFISNLNFFSKRKEEYFRDIRLIFLSSAIIWSSIMALGTELLSVFNKLNYSGIIVFWSLISVVFGSYLYQQKNTLKQRTKEYLPIKIPVNFLTISISLILLVTLFIALYIPPNNLDALSYHLTKVAFWQQNESIEHFPTSDLRQIALQPLAEIFILHFRILSESDLFTNFIQWFSFLGSLIGISYIAYLFRADKKTQLLSAFIGATIPMAILQATSTQNDLVNSFFCISFVIFILLLLRTKKRTFVLLSGLSLGLALLTKGTAYLYTFPFIMYYIIITIKQYKGIKWQFIKEGLIISSITLLLNFGYFYRNITVLSHPFGNINSISFENELHTPSALASNISRNFINHLSLPSEELNKPLVKGLKKLHSFLDLEINDIRTTLGGWMYIENNMSISEDNVRNFFHAILLIMLFLTIFFQKNLIRRNRFLIIYLLLLLLSYLMFNFYLKWQPWHSRLQTPLFLLFSPALAIWVCNFRSKFIIKSIILILFIEALIPLFFNRKKCIFPTNKITLNQNKITKELTNYPFILSKSKWNMMLINTSEREKKTYLDVIEFCKKGNYKKIGISSNYGVLDYLFLNFIREKEIEFNYVNIKNNTKTLIKNDFVPEVVIVTIYDKENLKIDNSKCLYNKVFQSGIFSIYKK